MCGIVGYIGSRQATGFLIEGLRRLEYRGYDSSGVGIVTSEGQLAVTKAAGRVENLATRLSQEPVTGRIGIGHTRWATHGEPNDTNAHPHFGGEIEQGGQAVAVVHNGVIENFRTIKERLKTEGVEFQSATDSEVIAKAKAFDTPYIICLPLWGGWSQGLTQRTLYLAACKGSVDGRGASIKEQAFEKRARLCC